MFVPKGSKTKVAIISVVVFAVASAVTWGELPVVSVVLGGLSAYRLVSLLKDKLREQEDEEE